MKLITEDTVRHLLRTKELRDGAPFELTQPSLLTPSAQSFLREHHIQVLYNLKKSGAAPVAHFSGQKKEPGVDQQLVSKQVLCECEHLSNLLYFPDFAETAFPGEWWLYFEQQQQWLAHFQQQGAKSGLTHTLGKAPATPLIIAPEMRRRWLFTTGEVNYQIEKILYLMTTESLSKEQSVFFQWSEELLKVIRSTKNE